MRRVVFRADGGRTLGAGHVMRCLAQSEYFRAGGWKIGFASRADTFSSIAALSVDWIERLTVTSADEAESLAARWPDGIDLLIVDHYGLDAAFESACRPWAKRILVIDDLADRKHDADVLVDVVQPDASYRELIPADCRLLSGTRYAILHPNFRLKRASALGRRAGASVERMVLSFGQIDSRNATLQAIGALDDAGFRGTFDVLLGGAAPHLAKVREAIGDRGRLHVNSSDVPTLFAGADLALGAGGVTAWERCCLGLPSVLVSIADNQRDTISLVVRSGAAIDAGSADPSLRQRLAAALRELLEDAARREAMSRAGAALVDGRGGERVMLAAIRPVTTNAGQIVTLCSAETDDESWFLELQRHPETRRFANRPSIPSPAEHRQWFLRTLADADRMLSIVECDGVPAGMLRLDRSAAADRISIAVMPAFHRRGIGAAVLELAARLVPGRCLEAEILPENNASLALFVRAGYRQVGKTLFKRVPK